MSYSTTQHILHDQEWRIHICRDVIKQIREKRYTIIPGLYITFDAQGPEFERAMLFHNTDRSNLLFLDLTDTPNHFHVCALGAIAMSILRCNLDCLLFSSILKNENPTPGTYRIDGNVVEYVCELLFTSYHQKLIEQAFEGDVPNMDNIFVNEFHDRYIDSNERLIAIMNNIIKNNGQFVLKSSNSIRQQQHHHKSKSSWL